MLGRVLLQRLRDWVKDDRGSAAVEFLLSSTLVLAIAAAGADLGAAMRASTALQAATADAGRILSLAPKDQNGVIFPEAIELAREEFAARLAEGGLAPSGAPAPSGADCSADGSLCHVIEDIPGSASALGRARSTIAVWSAATVPVNFIDVFSGDAAPAAKGYFRVVSDSVQVHHR
ncbi:MAG: TadE/TadG family type IV pilus assembly protein [Pseudomonadota bacterium]